MKYVRTPVKRIRWLTRPWVGRFPCKRSPADPDGVLQPMQRRKRKVPTVLFPFLFFPSILTFFLSLIFSSLFFCLFCCCFLFFIFLFLYFLISFFICRADEPTRAVPDLHLFVLLILFLLLCLFLLIPSRPFSLFSLVYLPHCPLFTVFIIFNFQFPRTSGVALSPICWTSARRGTEASLLGRMPSIPSMISTMLTGRWCNHWYQWWKYYEPWT